MRGALGNRSRFKLTAKPGDSFTLSAQCGHCRCGQSLRCSFTRSAIHSPRSIFVDLIVGVAGPFANSLHSLNLCSACKDVREKGWKTFTALLSVQQSGLVLDLRSSWLPPPIAMVDRVNCSAGDRPVRIKSSAPGRSQGSQGRSKVSKTKDRTGAKSPDLEKSDRTGSPPRRSLPRSPSTELA